MSDLPDDALDRLLGAWKAPPLTDEFAARAVAEATRPDRPRLPPPAIPRRTGRRWTRRGVWAGVVALNLMLATAVAAAAFGGGALDFASIRRAAVRVAEHILPHHRPSVAVADHHIAPPIHAAVPIMPPLGVRASMPISRAPAPTAPRLRRPDNNAPIHASSSRRPEFRSPPHRSPNGHRPIAWHARHGPATRLHGAPSAAGRHPRFQADAGPRLDQRPTDRPEWGSRLDRPRVADRADRFEHPAAGWRGGSDVGEDGRGSRFAAPRWRGRDGLAGPRARNGWRRGQRAWGPRRRP